MERDSLVIGFSYEEFLGARVLDWLDAQLSASAGRWCQKVRVSATRTDWRDVDSAKPGDLAEAVLDVASRRGPLYAALVARDGPGNERLFGWASLRGATTEVSILLRVDEEPYPRMMGEVKLGNWVDIQLRRSTVAGLGVIPWAVHILERAGAAAATPAWAVSYLGGEFEAKAMADQNAVGIDISRHIRGIFWLNFFGPRYCEFIGRQRLLTAPAYRVEAVGQGVVVQSHESPHAWATEEYLATQEAVLDHIGRQYFFDRRYPDRETVAPDWPPMKAPPTGPPPRVQAIVRPGEPLRVLIDGEKFPVPREDANP